MRIAILTNTFPPDGRGGAERIAWIQAKHLAALGHSVHVWKPIGPEEPETDGYEVSEFTSSFYSLPTHGPLFRLFFHLFDLRSARKLVREILEWKPDALVTHNVIGCGIGTARAVQKKNVRWLHVLHDVQLFEPSGQIRANERKHIFSSLWRIFWAGRRRSHFGIPDVFVSPTRWLLDRYHTYGFSAKADAILPNPIDDDLAKLSEESRPFISPASILYAGRLSEDKGFGMFLRALRMLDPKVVLSGIVIAGDGPLLSDAHGIDDERMECVGWLSPEEIPIAIKNAALLIAPSLLQENQQTILLEAMAVGTPAIATDVGGTHETLEGTGCPVLPTNQDLGLAIANEIKRILSDGVVWKQLSDAMRQQAKKHEVGEYIKRLVEAMAIQETPTPPISVSS
ncbi:MAG: glycosyltransferase family 4 protein [Patescibacteria group bacterium]